ncbi:MULTISPECIES: DUF3226 domain-containing protein [unclassified Microcoleus]|uniref:DUF3226 domain-containing protein n=1 Tax=unclassified Microcoleus TaxID=2642155 RepID=UPI001DEA3CCB|nr:MULTISPECIES: DUF3226 domain-containing protein [unclassified Microcoleus]MCC3600645.1 hypothetical protein [Microcoleus sp. PH2017_26_ELK_O_A]MCC3625779.1 hypothetical protein [Microcoleus sp. PH2017_36_ELK_O_B]
MSNIVIVESKNDAIFMKAMVDFINCDIQVEPPIYIDDYECLEGLSETKLITTLKALEADLQKRDIEKIGIIIDIDNYSEQERLQFVDRCIQQVFEAESLSSTKQFIDICTTDHGTNAKLACYFTNVGGKGELETLLKAIKAKDSPYADCLDSWKTCLENQGKKINQKDFDKFWISNYIRYDTCSNQEQKQAGKKCSMSGFDYVMEHKKDIWDWDNPALDDLKDFFRLFC